MPANTPLSDLISKDLKARGFKFVGSTVIYAHRQRLAKNPSMELMISVMLHKMDDSEWTVEELAPISKIEILDVTPSLSPLGAKLLLADNTVHEVYFENIDGNRSF